MANLKRWTAAEVGILKKKYFDTPNLVLLKILPGRTINSINLKAAKIGLKKNSKIKSESMIKRNKEMGRDLTHDLLFLIASGYTSKTEFQKKDPSAYTTCRKKGILEEACKHMICKAFSTPQMILNQLIKEVFKVETSYNNRKIIYPLEIDIFIEEYGLGFEYNGGYWHKNDTVDKISICKEKGILLININQKTRKYEDDIKKDLCENLKIINEKLNKQITEKEILSQKVNYDEIYKIENMEDIKKICDSYVDYSTFLKENTQIVRILRKRGILKELTSHMKRKSNTWDHISIKKELQKYKNLSDLIKYNFKVYLYCRRNNPAALKELKYKEGYENRFGKK
jgi:hypothetical protein